MYSECRFVGITVGLPGVCLLEHFSGVRVNMSEGMEEKGGRKVGLLSRVDC